MILNTSKGRRWTLMLGAAAVAAATLGVATPAQAYWRHGWGPGIGIGFGFYPYAYGYGYPGYVYAPPVAYAPPPAYYPPSTYYSRTSITNTTKTHHSTVRHHVNHKAASCAAPQADSHAGQTLNSDGSYTPNAVQQTNPSAPPSSPAQDGPPPKY